MGIVVGSGGLRTGGHRKAGLEGESSSCLASSFLASGKGEISISTLAMGNGVSFVSSLTSRLVDGLGDQSGESCAMGVRSER